jgi:hypothetical protein
MIMMSSRPRTLVCIIGQTRAHELTWENFKSNVLDELGADLALCIGFDANYDTNNPFWQNAKYGWLVLECPDFTAEVDRISLSLGIVPRWGQLCAVPTHDGFFGGAGGLPGAGALNMIFRWHLREGICREHLLDKYDQFIITRSDFIYTVPHPKLEVGGLWVPDGEDYAGITDRHLVVDAANLVPSLSMIEDLLCNPEEWTKLIPLMHYRNFEGVLEKYFERSGLLARVSRFPYIMYGVRGAGDPTRGSRGVFYPELGYYVKYPSEYALAQQFRVAA